MSLIEQIDSELTQALKGKDHTTVSVLRMLKSVLKNKEIDKKDALTDEEVLDTISREAKKRKESITAFEQGGRAELAKQEQHELEVLGKYLPEQMSEDEIRAIVQKIITDTGASTIQDIGKVMGAAVAQTKGKADGSMVSKIAKELLG